MATQNFKTLYVKDTIHSADSVEWCPFSPYKNSFVCGTYHLAEKNENTYSETRDQSCQRTGSISVFTVLKDRLEKNHSLECPAILDMKWCTEKLNGEIVLAAANAAGEVCLFYFENKILKFVSKSVLKKGTGDFLTLSIDWAIDSSNLICASDSKGNISVLKFCNGALIVLKEWNAHSLEAWIACFDSFNSNVIISGGDEAQLKVWDHRCMESVASSSKHSSGVTALASNIYKEFNLISGSYDESVLFWDSRNWNKPIDRITASGGVWRLKWERNSRSCYILSACIYGGFQIYNADRFLVIANLMEHESLAYGVDWCHLNNNEVADLLGYNKSALIATCSFYDHKLCVSLFDEISEY